MASPHSRRQTTGAFGNNKPRDITRDFTRSEPAPVDTTPREPSFADKLITFAQPILEQAGGNHTAAKGAMNVAILIWNACIEGEAKVKEAKITLAKLPGASAEQVEELVTTMAARKTELYPEEKMIEPISSLSSATREAPNSASPQSISTRKASRRPTFRIW